MPVCVCVYTDYTADLLLILWCVCVCVRWSPRWRLRDDVVDDSSRLSWWCFAKEMVIEAIELHTVRQLVPAQMRRGSRGWEPSAAGVWLILCCVAVKPGWWGSGTNPTSLSKWESVFGIQKRNCNLCCFCRRICLRSLCVICVCVCVCVC